MDLLDQSFLASDATEATNATASTPAANPAAAADAVPAHDARPLQPGDDALLGLPPGVSAPENIESTLSPDAAQQVQWYHLDPNERYEDLRLGEGPGIYRGLAFGGLMSILAIGLFYGCMWMAEPSAAMLNPFVDRSYSEAREQIAIHLGGLAPMSASPTSPGTTQPTADAKTFEIADLRSAHRPSPNGDSMQGAITWYRFDLPREQVPLYRQHMVQAWLNALKHRVEDGGGDPAFEKSGAPPFWDADEFDDGTRIRLIQSNGDVAFQAAFSKSRGRVYIRVNH